MIDALVEGERIEIRGFGDFDLHLRARRIARNPKTGEVLDLGVKIGAHFKPVKNMRDWTNAASKPCCITECFSWFFTAL
jgi:integration host factor subunit beta